MIQKMPHKQILLTVTLYYYTSTELKAISAKKCKVTWSLRSSVQHLDLTDIKKWIKKKVMSKNHAELMNFNACEYQALTVYDTLPSSPFAV